jgi:hypothetical protein
MAALAGITAVRPTANSVERKVTYGGTVAAGQPLYQDPTDSKFKLTDANLSDIAAAAQGIAMTPGVDNGSGLMAIQGDIVLVGTTMVVGETYYAGPTPGEIIPTADLATGDRVTRLGTAVSATVLRLSIEATGITRL